MVDAPSERQFSDEEVAAIFRNAAEQQSAVSPVPPTRGLTLVELEQVAAEVGLDRGAVHRAVRELDSARRTPRQNRLLGAASGLVVERVVEGRAGQAAQEAVLAELRRITGSTGEVSALGNLFGWRGPLHKATLDVQVSEEQQRTVIRIRASLSEVVGDSFVAPSVLAGGGCAFVAVAAAGGSPGPLHIAVAAAGAALAYAGSRWWYGRRVEEYRAHIASVAESLEHRVAEVVRQSGAIA